METNLWDLLYLCKLFSAHCHYRVLFGWDVMGGSSLCITCRLNSTYWILRAEQQKICKILTANLNTSSRAPGQDPYLISVYRQKGQSLIILYQHRSNLDWCESTASDKAHCPSEMLVKMLIISIDPSPLISYAPNRW